MQTLQLVRICGAFLMVGVGRAWDDYHALDFLQDVKRLHGMETILFALNSNVTEIGKPFLTYANEKEREAAIETDEFSKELMNSLLVPVIQMNELSPTMYLKKAYMDSIMAVVYLDGSMNDHRGLLQKLLQNLRHMTLSKTLFLINHDKEDFDLMRQIFLWCWRSKIPNVVALFSNYQTSENFYSYSHFPEFHIETKRILIDHFNRKDIYPNRMNDLKGYKLPYILGGSDFRIIMYLNGRGEVVVGGFVGHFLRTFAEHYNFKFVEPMPAEINNFAPSQDLVAAVRNGSVELSAALTFPLIPFIGYTYPYEQLNWCIMLPIEPNIPAYEFYVVVFETSAFLITLALLVLISLVLSWALCMRGRRPDIFDLVLHENCLRGVLGQSFTEIMNPPPVVRFIYLQICMLGILMTATYNSYFSTYVTSPPKGSELRTYDDILDSGLMLYAWAPEYKELLGRLKEFAKYDRMFYQETNYRRYVATRDSFDTSYGYLIPTSKWILIQEQQKIFAKHLFRLREDLCFFNTVPMCFPVHENSIYKEILYDMTLMTAQSGLTTYWRQNGFIESIVAGKLSFVDLSSRDEYTSMKSEDLIYVWYGYAAMVALSTTIFLGELLVFHRRKIRVFRVLGKAFEWLQRKMRAMVMNNAQI